MKKYNQNLKSPNGHWWRNKRLKSIKGHFLEGIQHLTTSLSLKPLWHKEFMGRKWFEKKAKVASYKQHVGSESWRAELRVCPGFLSTQLIYIQRLMVVSQTLLFLEFLKFKLIKIPTHSCTRPHTSTFFPAISEERVTLQKDLTRHKFEVLYLFYGELFDTESDN